MLNYIILISSVLLTFNCTLFPRRNPCLKGYVWRPRTYTCLPFMQTITIDGFPEEKYFINYIKKKLEEQTYNDYYVIHLVDYYDDIYRRSPKYKLAIINLVSTNTTELHAMNFKGLSLEDLRISYNNPNELGRPEANFLKPLETTLTSLTVEKTQLPPMPAASVIQKGQFKDGTSDGSFGGCMKLKELYLKNWTVHSDDWVANCSRLRKLKMENMKITDIDRILKQVQDSNLHSLDLSRNPHYDICRLYNYDDSGILFEISFPELEEIDLSETQSNVKCLKTKKFPSLKFLDLRNNHIETVMFQELLELSVPLKIDFQHNPINSINFTKVDFENMIHFYKENNLTSHPMIELLGSFVIDCDCANAFFAKSLREQLVKAYARCKEEINLKLAEVQPKQLECDKFSCERCTCRRNWLDSSIAADCRDGRGTICGVLEISTKNLTHLNASNSRLTHIEEKDISNSLKILDLVDNNISHITEDVARKIFSVKERTLLLSRNSITCNCDNEPFIRMTQNHRDQVTDYQHLTCFGDSNNTLLSDVIVSELCTTDLSNLTEKVAENLFSVKDRRLSLTGKAIKCNCGNKPVIYLIQQHHEKVLNYKQISCSDESNRLPLSEVNVSKLCVLTITDMKVIITSFIGSGFLVLVTIIAILIQCRYGRSIRIYLFARGWCLCCIREDEIDADKAYDAFVAFCHDDHPLISEEFVPKLEAQGFKVCVHYRDWIAGEYIPTQMANSVDSSRRTIIFLSQNFVNSMWGMLEFRTAHAKAYKEGVRRIILVILDDVVNDSTLDADLRSYIRTNTYLCWKDPWFWDKICYAMPKPRNLDKNNKIISLERVEIVN